MAAPHLIPMSEIGFNSKTRTVYNLALPTPVIDVFKDTSLMPLDGYLQPLGGGQRQPLAFTTALNPSGSAAGPKTPPDAMLFAACGLKCVISTTASWTASFTGDLITDVTPVDISVAVGNALKFVADDAVGNLTIRALAGQPIMLDWNFEGAYTAPSEAALSDALANGGPAPVCVANTTSLDGDTLVIRSWSIALNNVIDVRPDLSAATGYQDSKIVRQTPTLEMLIEIPAVGTANYWTDLLTQGGTLKAFSTVVGTGAGYIITVTGKFYLAAAPALQTLGAGILGARLSYQMDTVSGSPIEIALT